MSLVSGPGKGGAGKHNQGLFVEKHVDYIKSLDKRKDEYEYWLTEHLRLNGVYWGLTALHLLGYPEALPRDETIDFVLSCQHENGGFGAAPDHDPHMLYTDRITGTFKGDEWGETDTRFLYGAFNALSLLNLLHMVDVGKAVSYVQSCANFDGGYGIRPGAESHSGQIFVCVGALAIAGRLDLVDSERLGAWLSERQLDHGGLNGRPGKKEDVCYSWIRN
ncbi:type II proteins geranylgeranyltransferase beta subunit [Uncinocarpus reesii 1704]|uniref:Geranylgeranyl transferase type-2 subunit beta n=1 Tax=Uncinocarpus reesii (strain UAMH 1704) TaxID=336963 RepID=C4JZY6_UNCRE|nr:type II proteins geranylgeranyltransferase beta subunit [Uncinocarpus reesii 1704]EEP82872.1 type II proteins geranylgeranyltransferase beta subunit [Uncinocarpus reesii 1704]